MQAKKGKRKKKISNLLNYYQMQIVIKHICYVKTHKIFLKQIKQKNLGISNNN